MSVLALFAGAQRNSCRRRRYTALTRAAPRSPRATITASDASTISARLGTESCDSTLAMTSITCARPRRESVFCHHRTQAHNTHTDNPNRRLCAKGSHIASLLSRAECEHDLLPFMHRRRAGTLSAREVR